MKQTPFTNELSQYFNIDVEAFFDKYIIATAQENILHNRVLNRMHEIAGTRITPASFINFIHYVADYEKDCYDNGITPNRHFYFKDPLLDVEEGEDIEDFYFDYEQDDVELFCDWIISNDDMFNAVVRINAPLEEGIINRFEANVDLIIASAKSVISKASKEDFKQFRNIGIDYYKRTFELSKHAFIDVTKDTYADNYVSASQFLSLCVSPFKEATVTILKQTNNGKKDHYLDYLFSPSREINSYIQSFVEENWYPKEKVNTPAKNDGIYEKYKNLYVDPKINALQTLNFQRDFETIKQRQTRSGGIKNDTVFVNNGVSIVFNNEYDLRLSTSTRQIADYYRSKATDQIARHEKDMNKLAKKRAVTVTIDEIAYKFNTDKKEARKLLTTFYNEIRDIKQDICYREEIDGKTKTTQINVNLFDGAIFEGEIKENNNVSKPEDLAEGEQITLYNTGTLYNYSHDRAKVKMPTGVVQKGKLTMQYSLDYAKHLAQAYIMPHNEKSYLINKKLNPSSYAIFYLLENQDNMNKDKSNAGIVTLETILKSTYEIPTYEEVMNGNRNVTKRIKAPLIRDIQALKEEYNLLSKCYYHTNKGKKISAEDLIKLDYEDFIECRLHFTLAPIDEDPVENSKSKRG